MRKQDEDTLPRQFMAFLSCQQLSEPSFSYRGLVTTGNKPRKDQVIWFISIPVLMPIYFFTPLPNASWLIRLRQRERFGLGAIPGSVFAFCRHPLHVCDSKERLFLLTFLFSLAMLPHFLRTTSRYLQSSCETAGVDRIALLLPCLVGRRLRRIQLTAKQPPRDAGGVCFWWPLLPVRLKSWARPCTSTRF